MPQSPVWWANELYLGYLQEQKRLKDSYSKTHPSMGNNSEKLQIWHTPHSLETANIVKSVLSRWLAQLVLNLCQAALPTHMIRASIFSGSKCTKEYFRYFVQKELVTHYLHMIIQFLRKMSKYTRVFESNSRKQEISLLLSFASVWGGLEVLHILSKESFRFSSLIAPFLQKDLQCVLELQHCYALFPSALPDFQHLLDISIILGNKLFKAWIQNPWVNLLNHFCPPCTLIMNWELRTCLTTTPIKAVLSHNPFHWWPDQGQACASEKCLGTQAQGYRVLRAKPTKIIVTSKVRWESE